MSTSSWKTTIGVLLVAAAIVAFAGRVGRAMPDFEVYRVAGARAVAGEELYRAEDGHWLFKYLPAYAFAMAPLAMLPDPIARVLWFSASAALLVFLVAQAWQLLPCPRSRATFVVSLTVIALGKFYARELLLGQSNVWLALLVLLAVGQWRAERRGVVGALLAAATLVKPYAVLFAPYLAARRQWRTLAVFSSCSVLILLLPAARYGWAGNLGLLAGWWETVTTSTAPNLIGQDNISIAGMYAKALGPGGMAAWLAAATSALVVVSVAGVLWRRPSLVLPEYLDAAVLLLLIPLLSPQGWDYVLLVATPGVMLLLDRLGESKRLGQVLTLACLAVLGLTLYDVMGRVLYRTFMMSPVPTLAALALMAQLLRLRLRRLA